MEEDNGSYMLAVDSEEQQQVYRFAQRFYQLLFAWHRRQAEPAVAWDHHMALEIVSFP